MERKQKLCYLFVLFCIFATDSMITISINQNLLYYYAFRVIAVLLCPILFFCSINIRKANKMWVFIFVVIALSLGATAVFNSDYVLSIPLKLVYLFLGYCAVKYFKSKNILKAFADIMFFIAVFSLVCYLFSLFNATFFDFLPNIRIVAAKSKRVSNFANAVFCTIPKTFWGSFPRNYGMFAEPGIYQVYLIFAMIAVLYGDMAKKKIKLLVFVVSMITTFSTTGYIVLLCLFLFYFITSFQMSPAVKIFAALGTLIVGYLIIKNEFLFSIVFEKLQDGGNASTLSRVYSFPINILIWLKSPLFGVGPAKINQYSELMAVALTNSNYFHNTNTYMYTLSSFGLLLFIVEVWKGLALAKRLTRGKLICTLGLFSIIFVCLSGENLTYSLCIETLLFCGSFSEHKPELERGVTT